MDIPEKTITEVVRNTKTFNYFEISDIKINKKKAFVSVKISMKSIEPVLNTPYSSIMGFLDVVLKQADFDAYVASKLDDTWLLNYISTYITTL